MAALGEDLLVTVNKLQDLVFNTIGNDSLDLPQIVSRSPLSGNFHASDHAQPFLLVHCIRHSPSSLDQIS